MYEDNLHHIYWTFAWVWSGGLHGYPPGSFSENLMQAFIKADDINLKRLASAFPVYAKSLELLKAGRVPDDKED